MSILIQTTPARPSLATIKANMIKQNAAQLANRIIKTWEQSFDAVWDNPNPSEILDELGTDAAELFVLSGATMEFLTAILQNSRPEDLARLQAKVAAMPPITINLDGTVSID